jgi:maleylpyruvate isomerase
MSRDHSDMIVDHAVGAPEVVASMIAGIQVGHQRLLGACVGLTNDACRAPSRLPGWTRGHVLTHLARNAEAVSRLCQGLIDGVPGVMYPGGPSARNEEIERGASRPAVELAADVAASAEVFEQLLPRVSNEAWMAGTVRGVTREWPATNLPWMRRREVETHAVDLDLGIEFSDLPTDYLRAELNLAVNRFTTQLPSGSAVMVNGVTEYSSAEPILHSYSGDLPTIVAWSIGRTTPKGWPELSWG